MRVSNVIYQLKQIGFTEMKDIYRNKSTLTGCTSEEWQQTKYASVPDFHITVLAEGHRRIIIIWKLHTYKRVKKVYNEPALFKFNNLEELLDDFYQFAVDVIQKRNKK